MNVASEEINVGDRLEFWMFDSFFSKHVYEGTVIRIAKKLISNEPKPVYTVEEMPDKCVLEHQITRIIPSPPMNRSKVALTSTKLTNAQIYNLWRYGYCQCQARKFEKQPFCYECFLQISATCRKDIANKKPGKGLENSYRRAYAELNGELETEYDGKQSVRYGKYQ